MTLTQSELENIIPMQLETIYDNTVNLRIVDEFSIAVLEAIQAFLETQIVLKSTVLRYKVGGGAP